MNNNLFNTISFIKMYSSDNKKLIHFYRDLLGIEPQQNQDENHNWYGFNTQGVTFSIELIGNRKHYPFEFNKENPILMQFKAKDEKALEEMNKVLES